MTQIRFQFVLDCVHCLRHYKGNDNSHVASCVCWLLVTNIESHQICVQTRDQIFLTSEEAKNITVFHLNMNRL